MNTLSPAAAAIEADKAWTAAYEAICPKGVWPGDFRYTDAAKGAPGSDLRALYDARRMADAAWHAAREGLHVEPARAGLQRRVFRRMECGSLEWCDLLDWYENRSRARFYGFCSRDLPFAA